MKDFKIPKLLPVGTELVCACNSGAKKLLIIGVKHQQSTDRRRNTAGVGSLVRVSVKEGKDALKGKIYNALVIRQKYPITRFVGKSKGKVCFRDNAAILLDEDAKVKKCVIKGPIAREVLVMKKHYEAIGGSIR